MKILILVQACDDAPYLEMNKAQMETWDSPHVEGVETIYYLSDKTLTEGRIEGNKFYAGGSEAYDMMHWRMKLTLDYVWNIEWDYIFRTNSSSYIDKKKLLLKAQTLPKEKCYCGIDAGFASGAGFFMSRDVVEILKNTLDDFSTPSEDACMGTILAKHGIKVTSGAERYDYYFHVHYDGASRKDNEHQLPNIYHYRCISDDTDRNKDIIAFRTIHKLKGH